MKLLSVLKPSATSKEFHLLFTVGFNGTNASFTAMVFKPGMIEELPCKRVGNTIITKMCVISSCAQERPKKRIHKIHFDNSTVAFIWESVWLQVNGQVKAWRKMEEDYMELKSKSSPGEIVVVQSRGSGSGNSSKSTTSMSMSSPGENVVVQPRGEIKTKGNVLSSASGKSSKSKTSPATKKADSPLPAAASGMKAARKSPLQHRRWTAESDDSSSEDESILPPLPMFKKVLKTNEEQEQGRWYDNPESQQNFL
jgi:hypothetical protein